MTTKAELEAKLREAEEVVLRQNAELRFWLAVTPLLKMLFALSCAVYETRVSGSERLRLLWRQVVTESRRMGLEDRVLVDLVNRLELHGNENHGDGCPVCRALRETAP